VTRGAAKADNRGGGGGSRQKIGTTAAADERLWQQETATRNGKDSGLAVMTVATYGNWLRTAMAADDDGVEQRWHARAGGG